MSFSIDVLKDARDELDMYQSLSDTKIDGGEFEDKMNDLTNAIKALESNNFNYSIHSVSQCPIFASEDLHQYQLHHIHCKDCKNDFDKGCD